jgi:hypothetical protein
MLLSLESTSTTEEENSIFFSVFSMLIANPEKLSQLQLRNAPFEEAIVESASRHSRTRSGCLSSIRSASKKRAYLGTP